MQDVPKISSPNLDYPAFSDAVTVVKNVDKGKLEVTVSLWIFASPGRYLVATRDIPVGEIVGVEEPICNILAPEKLGENKPIQDRGDADAPLWSNLPSVTNWLTNWLTKRGGPQKCIRI